jgi:hypothetical protein
MKIKVESAEISFLSLAQRIQMSFNIKDLTGREKVQLFKALGTEMDIFSKLDVKNLKAISEVFDKFWSK